MKAIILAAGYATRLYPLTIDTPKPLLMVGGRPMLEHIMVKIEELEDVDEVFVVTNDKFFRHFVEWQNRYKSNKRINIINDYTTSNDNRLGAVGDIHFVVSNEDIDDSLLVIAGDNLFEFSLLHLDEFFKKSKTSVVALYDLLEKENAKKYGVVETDKKSRIVGFEEKPQQPKSSLISTACYIFTKKSVQMLERCMKEQNKPDNLGDFIKWLSEKEQVHGFVFKERWFDIGSKEQLEEVNKLYSDDN